MTILKLLDLEQFKAAVLDRRNSPVHCEHAMREVVERRSYEPVAARIAPRRARVRGTAYQISRRANWIWREGPWVASIRPALPSGFPLESNMYRFPRGALKLG